MPKLKICKMLQYSREETNQPVENIHPVPIMQMQGTPTGVKFFQNEIPTSKLASWSSAAGRGSNWSDVIEDYSFTESEELQRQIGDFGNKFEEVKLKVGEKRTRYQHLEWIRINPELQIRFMPSVKEKILSLDQEIQIQVEELRVLEEELNQSLESFVRKMKILVNTTVCTELIPPLKWSSWEMSDISPPLDKIQSLYSTVIDSIVRLSSGLKTCVKQCDIVWVCPLWNTFAQKAILELDQMYRDLMLDAMVVDIQPEQIFKTKGAPFILSVRFLCGHTNFQGHSLPPVDLKLVNEKEMGKLYDRLANKPKNNVRPVSVDNRIVPAGVLQFDSAVDVKNCAVYSFGGVRVNDVTRKFKGKSDGNEVMKEKYCFLFQSSFSIGPESFQTYCSSLPCVIYTDSKYIPDGWKTLFWENSFRKGNRVPFDVPDRVPWPRMAAALNNFIKDRTGTTRELTPTNIAYLKEKFSFLFTNGQEYVTRADFEDKVNPHGMTMWHYTCSIIELINKHLKTQWDKGYVVGFIGRKEAESLLARQRDDGAFLVRFSDSEAGGVSIPFSWELPDGTFYADSLGPLKKDGDKLKNICETINEVAIKYNTRYILLTSVYYQEITGEDEREELIRMEHKMRAFPPNFPNGNVDNSPRPKWGYVKIVSVAVAVHDDQPIENYSRSPPCEVNAPSQTTSSALFLQEQLRGTGTSCPGGGPAYETYVNNRDDLLQFHASADMELDMVD